jgi:putative CocE/NonD family hydrolase
MRSRRRVLLQAVATILLCAGLPASGENGEDGRRFTVPTRPGRYAVAATSQQMWVTAADGTKLFVETWLPTAKGKAVPPKRVPVVVDITPYALKGVPRPDRGSGAEPRWTELLVSRGYALANVHLRGTGESGGCWTPHGQQDADDASRALDALTRAPFSDGRLALIGKSHDGGAAINVAEHGDRKQLRGLKALVVLSPVFSYADFILRDGVPAPKDQAYILQLDHDTSLTSRTATNARDTPMVESWATSGNKSPVAAADRAPCRAQETQDVLATDGRMTPWLRERELALDTGKIQVPVLMSYGLEEMQTRQLVGAFDGIRAPKAAVLSAAGHDFPDANSLTPTYSRSDWEAMVIAWLDRWVLGVRTSGVSRKCRTPRGGGARSRATRVRAVRRGSSPSAPAGRWARPSRPARRRTSSSPPPRWQHLRPPSSRSARRR